MPQNGGGGISEVEQARRTVIRAFMGFGSASTTGQQSGFRANNRGNGTNCARDWKNFPEHLTRITERLRGVVIENRDAIQVMRQQDQPETLHYADPPYLHSARSPDVTTGKRKCYRFEMSDQEHEMFLIGAKELKGMVIISGYDNELYNDMLTGWRTETRRSFADGARPRIEKLWISPNIKEETTLFTNSQNNQL